MRALKIIFGIIALFVILISQIDAFNTVSSPDCYQKGFADDTVNGFGYYQAFLDGFIGGCNSTNTGTYIRLQEYGEGLTIKTIFNGSYTGAIYSSGSFYPQYQSENINSVYKVKEGYYILNIDVSYNPQTSIFIRVGNDGIFTGDVYKFTTHNFFVNENYIIKDNGANLEYYTYDSNFNLTLYNTVTKPTGFVSNNGGQTLPGYCEFGCGFHSNYINTFVTLQNGSSGWFYMNTNGNASFLKSDGSLYSAVSGFNNSYLIGNFESNLSNTNLIWSNYNGTGNYLDYNSNAGNFSSLLLETGSIIYNKTYFDNPTLYFNTSAGIKSYDVNCITPGYSSCQVLSGVNKCTDGNTNPSPNGELCQQLITPPGPENCHDQIQNQDETGIDTGGVCGNQTCRNIEVNQKYPAPSYTGAYNTYTKESFGSGVSHVEVLTPPSSYNGYQFEKTELNLVGGIITSSGNDFSGLWNNNFRFTVPGYIQSPLLSLDFQKAYLEITSIYPVEWIYINGTGTTSEGTGTIDNEDSGDQFLEGYKCVFIQNNNGANIANNACYKVSDGTVDYRYTVTNLITPDYDRKYRYSINFIQSALDKDYIITGLGFGHFADQFIERYVCTKDDGTITADGNPISADDLGELTGSGDIIRQQQASGSINGAVTGGIVGGFTFNVLENQGVGSGTDCSQMFNGTTFLYSSSSGSFVFDFSSNFKLSGVEWSCSFLGADICNVGYQVTEGLIRMVLYSVQETMNIILSPFLDGLKYIGYPVKGHYYCYFGENKQFIGRTDSYYSYVDHQTNDITGKTGIDYFIIAILVIVLVVIIFK